MKSNWASSAAICLGVVLGMGLGIQRANASFHLWKIDEVYSNASGSVQFIEFQQGAAVFDDERFLSGQGLTDSSFSHAFSFAANLSSAPTANSHFLVGTPGYAALSGVPAPDYTLPVNDWFNPLGDTITYAGGVSTLTFTSGQLPTDGVNSLKRAYTASTFTTSANSPTNFLGTSGAVSLPEPGMMMLAALSGLSLLRRCQITR